VLIFRWCWPTNPWNGCIQYFAKHRLHLAGYSSFEVLNRLRFNLVNFRMSAKKLTKLQNRHWTFLAKFLRNNYENAFTERSEGLGARHSPHITDVNSWSECFWACRVVSHPAAKQVLLSPVRTETKKHSCWSYDHKSCWQAALALGASHASSRSI